MTAAVARAESMLSQPAMSPAAARTGSVETTVEVVTFATGFVVVVVLVAGDAVDRCDRPQADAATRATIASATIRRIGSQRKGPSRRADSIRSMAQPPSS